jgi:CDP-diacylglycerol--glycerol-3-phosphate 3-phosphatidyltransferase
MWNVPNKISAARLVLAVGVFAFLETGFYQVALILFLIAAGTDWMDGWYARKYDQVTKLGRILDPFCDKILICGTYVLLALEMSNHCQVFPWYARVMGWMAIVVVGRELLVTVIRSMVEGSGGDFSANMAGKLKMWFQCIAVVSCLLALIYNQSAEQAAVEAGATIVPSWIWYTMIVFIWLSLWSTVQSGWNYVQIAAKLLNLSSK